MLKKIALIGNPNSGKTTFFNYVTGGNEYVGNRCGVTVSPVTRKIKNTDFILCDLPGIYSLRPLSSDESAASDFIKKEKLHGIINIIDINNLERSLFLTIELILLGIPIVAVINMADEMEKRGISIDLLKLEGFLGISVFKISAKTGEGIKGLTSSLSAMKKPLPVLNEKYHKIFSDLKTESEDVKKALTIYKISEETVKLSLYIPKIQKRLTDKLDKIFLNRYLAFPLLIFITAFLFFMVFGPPGAIVEKLILKAFDFFIISPFNLIFKGSPAFFIIDAVLTSAGTVLSFTGQLLILFFLISILEDTGYMARASFITDKLFRNAGLSGNSFIPLILGLGCTTTAVMAARSIMDEKEKRLLTILTPFIPCSGKLPVYFYFAGLFFPEIKGWVILFIYLLSVSTAVIAGKFLSVRFIVSDSLYSVELPSYRAPDISLAFLNSVKKLKEFFIRFGTTVFLMSAVIWILHNFDFSFNPVKDEAKSILAITGKAVSPFFKPLGFGMWQLSVSLLFGIIAKESVLASIGILLKNKELLSLLGIPEALSFLCFFTLYFPCASAISVMAKELKSKKILFLSLFMHLFIAYSFSFIIYTVAKVF